MSDSSAPAAAEEAVAEEQAAQDLLSAVSRHWGVLLAGGALAVIIGGLILARPFGAVKVAALLFGIWLLVTGVFQVAMSFDKQSETSVRVLNALTGVIGIVLGVLCFKSVENRISLLVLFIGISWVLRGILQLFAGASSGGDKWWIFAGLIGLIAGICVLVWPVTSLGVLTLLTGIWLVIIGLVEIVAAFRLRSAGKALAA